MSGLVAWWRWEASRRIEVTPFIRFITVERFVKGTVLVLAGVALLALGADDRFESWIANVQEEINLQNSASLVKRLVDRLVTWFGSASPRERDVIGIGAILYGLLEAFEGVGLLLRRRWAEYLVLVATGAFLPLEVDEIVRRVTVVKAGALLVNIAIMAYLVWRKRLFLERPDRGEAQPA